MQDNSTPEGSPNLNVVPLELIERIEIIKGPYSSLYGSGAIGGVIQIFTKKTINSNNKGSLSLGYGNHNTNKIQFSYGIAKKTLSTRINISQYTTDGISSHVGDMANEKDGVNRKSQSVNISYKFNKKLDTSINFLKDNTITEYDNAYGADNHQLQAETNFRQISTNINYKLSNKWQTKLLLANNTQQREHTNAGVFSFGGNVDTYEYTWLNDISLKTNEHLITAGYTYLKDNNNNDNTSVSSNSIFAQQQLKINSTNDLVVGFRATRHQKFGNHNTYNIGYSNKINNKLKLSASLGSAFKAPVFDQLFDRPYSTGNPDLKPETAQNIELSINYKHQPINANISFYKNKINNDIEGVSNSTFHTFYSNRDIAIISKGIDLDLAFKTINNLAINLSYYYNSSKENQDNASQLARRPKESYKISANKNFKKFDTTIEWIKKGSSTDLYNTTLESYQLTNLLIQYKLQKNLKITTKINNLFDQDYQVASGFNQLGRNINLELNYNF